MGPVRYWEVRSIPSKYAQNFIFDPFLWFFPFDSLGCVQENPCPDIGCVPFTECLVCRGTTVSIFLVLIPYLSCSLCAKWHQIRMAHGSKSWIPNQTIFYLRDKHLTTPHHSLLIVFLRDPSFLLFVIRDTMPITQHTNKYTKYNSMFLHSYLMFGRFVVVDSDHNFFHICLSIFVP